MGSVATATGLGYLRYCLVESKGASFESRVRVGPQASERVRINTGTEDTKDTTVPTATI